MNYEDLALKCPKCGAVSIVGAQEYLDESSFIEHEGLAPGFFRCGYPLRSNGMRLCQVPITLLEPMTPRASA